MGISFLIWAVALEYNPPSALRRFNLKYTEGWAVAVPSASVSASDCTPLRFDKAFVCKQHNPPRNIKV